jgi:branched-chain amino acid transport system ATP-binding protein
VAAAADPPGGRPALTLTVERVSGGYGDLRVLWDVSISVAPSTISVILGRNGAGKTTLLRTISGLNQSTSGRIELEGVDVTRLPIYKRARQGVAFVQEGKRVFRQRTVVDNLNLGAYRLGLRGRALVARRDAMLTRFPMLEARQQREAGELSGGQQQMLAIAVALIGTPKLLMLDEPSAGLAPAAVAEVFALVSELATEGLAVLLVEQAAENALAIADAVTILDVGRVVELNTDIGRTPTLDTVRKAYMGKLS